MKGLCVAVLCALGVMSVMSQPGPPGPPRDIPLPFVIRFLHDALDEEGLGAIALHCIEELDDRGLIHFDRPPPPPPTTPPPTKRALASLLKRFLDSHRTKRDVGLMLSDEEKDRILLDFCRVFVPPRDEPGMPPPPP